MKNRGREIQLCIDVSNPILESIRDGKTLDADHVKRAYEGIRVQNTTLRTELAVEKFKAQLKARTVKITPRRKKSG